MKDVPRMISKFVEVMLVHCQGQGLQMDAHKLFCTRRLKCALHILYIFWTLYDRLVGILMTKVLSFDFNLKLVSEI